MNYTFPEILKELRKEKKLTLQAMVEKTGIPYASLQGYETGRVLATYPVIITLAKFFNVSCGQLLGTEDL